MDHRKRTLWLVFLIVFIDLIGFGLAIPLVPSILLGNSFFPASVSLATRNLLLGFMLAAFPFAQFFASPLLGALSDRHGRKAVFIVSIIGSFVGYFLFAVGIWLHSLPLMLFSRLLDGFTGGNIATAFSTIADISDEKTRAKDFGLISMAFGLGFILGPVVGGELSNSSLVSWFNFSTPFLFATLIGVLNLLFVLVYFKETLKEKVTRPLSLLTGPRNVRKAFSILNLRVLFLVVFLVTFGFGFFGQFFSVFLIERFGFTPVMIGLAFAYIGLWVALTQGIIIRPVTARVAPAPVLRYSLLLLSVALFLLLFMTRASFLLYILPFVALFNGLTGPTLTALVSHQSGAESQGEVLGLNQSVQSLAQMIPPIVAGAAAAISASLPIILAGGTIFVAWLAFLTYKPRLQERFHEE